MEISFDFLSKYLSNVDVLSEFCTPSDKQIRAFLKEWAKRYKVSMSESYVELLMDDHFYIEFKNGGYFVPKGNSMFLPYDSYIQEYLYYNLCE